LVINVETWAGDHSLYFVNVNCTYKTLRNSILLAYFKNVLFKNHTHLWIDKSLIVFIWDYYYLEIFNILKITKKSTAWSIVKRKKQQQLSA